MAAASPRLLAFAAGGERLAMSADDVVEVLSSPTTARLPHAPPSLRGLANVRGQVVPVVSLARLLELDAGPEARLVMLGGAKPVGLLVDEVSALVESDRSARLVEPRQLLERAFASQATRSAKLAAGIESSSAEATQVVPSVALLAFTVGAQEFGLPLAEVGEVLRLPKGVAALPHGGEAIIGTTSHRGRLVPLLDLSVLLGLAKGERIDQRRVLLARVGAHVVGLVVDTVNDVLYVAEDLIDPLPTVLARRSAEARIQAICRLDGGRRLVSVLSSERLLSDEITARLIEEGDEDMTVVAEDAAGEEQILLFTLGGDEFGLPVAAVREVARRPERLTSLPRAPAFVDGIMNLRGQVLPVIDQRRRFGAAHGDGARKPVLVVTMGDAQAGFVVDAVTRVASVPAAALQPAPDLGMDEAGVIDRVATLEVDGRLVLLVNPQELLDRAERDLLAAMEGGAEAPPRS